MVWVDPLDGTKEYTEGWCLFVVVFEAVGLVRDVDCKHSVRCTKSRYCILRVGPKAVSVRVLADSCHSSVIVRTGRGLQDLPTHSPPAPQF